MTERTFAILWVLFGGLVFIADIYFSAYKKETTMKMAGICSGLIVFVVIAVSIILGVI